MFDIFSESSLTVPGRPEVGIIGIVRIVVPPVPGNAELQRRIFFGKPEHTRQSLIDFSAVPYPHINIVYGVGLGPRAAPLLFFCPLAVNPGGRVRFHPFKTNDAARIGNLFADLSALLRHEKYSTAGESFAIF